MTDTISQSDGTFLSFHLSIYISRKKNHHINKVRAVVISRLLLSVYMIYLNVLLFRHIASATLPILL